MSDVDFTSPGFASRPGLSTLHFFKGNAIHPQVLLKRIVEADAAIKVESIPTELKDALNDWMNQADDQQLCYWYNELKRKIFYVCRDGSRYGIDLPTLSMVNPVLYEALMTFRTEGNRRMLARHREWINHPNVAWTGGSTPYIGKFIASVPGAAEAILKRYVEQCEAWSSYWQEKVPYDLANIYYGRAVLDAFATYRDWRRQNNMVPVEESGICPV